MSTEDAVKLALGERNSATPEQLTFREREVVRLVARGWTNHQIGDALVIDQRTAEGHVSRILARLGLRKRAQIAAWAVQNGLAAAPPADVSA
jgi:DNA-binding NarL/FixJ family response regulator